MSEFISRIDGGSLCINVYIIIGKTIDLAYLYPQFTSNSKVYMDVR